MINELLLNNIINKISFKIGPSQNVRKQYMYRFKKKIYKFFNKEKKFINSNTNFENIDNLDHEVIEKLSNIHSYSTISIGFIINQIAKNLGSDAIYLNIGVWRGFSMFAGMLNTKCEVYGIDNFSHDYADANKSLSNYEESKKTKEYFFKKFNNFKIKEKHFFYDMDYKKFFKLWESKNKKIDFYYYDGEHSYINQYDNLIIAHNFLDKGSIILIDDYNEAHVENATFDFISKFNKDYKILKKFKTINRLIHPSYANGIILIEKIS
jgi:hypothetical protein